MLLETRETKELKKLKWLTAKEKKILKLARDCRDLEVLVNISNEAIKLYEMKIKRDLEKEHWEQSIPYRKR